MDLKDTISGFKGVLEGKYDDLPEMAFYMVRLCGFACLAAVSHSLCNSCNSALMTTVLGLLLAKISSLASTSALSTWGLHVQPGTSSQASRPECCFIPGASVPEHDVDAARLQVGDITEVQEKADKMARDLGGN